MISYPLGSEIFQAVNGFTFEGRIVFTGSPIWTQDSRPGIPARDITPTAHAANNYVTDKIMEWLFPGGPARILALQRLPVVLGDDFGAVMEADLVGQGHTFTRSGEAGSFATYDWHDFDVIFLSAAYSTTPAGAPNFGALNATLFDAALAANKAALIVPTYQNTFVRYGLAYSPGYQSQFFSPDFLSYPFDCAPLGIDDGQLSCYSSFIIGPGTNTIGGTYTIYPSSLGEGVISLWLAS